MSLYIKHDPVKGRGVFTAEDIPKGEVIEICELIFLRFEDISDSLEPYVYQYNNKLVAVALGNGSLYNHSSRANAVFSFNKSTKQLQLVAKNRIKADTEITINYGYNKTQKRKFRIT